MTDPYLKYLRCVNDAWRDYGLRRTEAERIRDEGRNKARDQYTQEVQAAWDHLQRGMDECNAVFERCIATCGPADQGGLATTGIEEDCDSCATALTDCIEGMQQRASEELAAAEKRYSDKMAAIQAQFIADIRAAEEQFVQDMKNCENGEWWKNRPAFKPELIISSTDTESGRLGRATSVKYPYSSQI